jgi:hypothetical protein
VVAIDILIELLITADPDVLRMVVARQELQAAEAEEKRQASIRAWMEAEERHQKPVRVWNDMVEGEKAA